jgi:hypothetical protein
MAAEPAAERWNYFNYFTEIEEHFQRARGTGLFLLSPLDWALIETWKNAGIPLEAVLRGIDSAFEKWHARKLKYREVNSLAFCAQAIYEEAQAMSGVADSRQAREQKAPFELEELRDYLGRNAVSLRKQPGFDEIAEPLEKLAAEAGDHYSNLERLEQRLTVLEEKMAAIARSRQTEENLLAARRDLDSTLRPYRSKMTTEQLSMLERQYLDRWLLERAGLPRLSLFYLTPGGTG